MHKPIALRTDKASRSTQTVN